jgi:uncharacterized tellurite resistance protein B-like protein
VSAVLDAVKQFFSEHIEIPQAEDGTTAKHAMNIAAAALLIEVGRADFEFSDNEQARIATLLRDSLCITDSEITELISLAKRESTESTSLHGFTRLIHENYSDTQKRKLMEQLWFVALADGRIDRYEDYILRKIADLIYLSHKDFIQAKLRAMGER